MKARKIAPASKGPEEKAKREAEKKARREADKQARRKVDKEVGGGEGSVARSTPPPTVQRLQLDAQPLRIADNNVENTTILSVSVVVAMSSNDAPAMCFAYTSRSVSVSSISPARAL